MKHYLKNGQDIEAPAIMKVSEVNGHHEIAYQYLSAFGEITDQNGNRVHYDQDKDKFYVEVTE